MCSCKALIPTSAIHGRQKISLPDRVMQAEVSQLRNANSDSVVDSEERLQQLQGDFEDLQR